jgi:cobalamin biosynthesis protein CobD/CbiB
MVYALGVRLGGTNYYDGEPVQGPVFNASGRTVATSDIKSSLTRIWWVVFAAGGLVLLMASVPSYLTQVTWSTKGTVAEGMK